MKRRVVISNFICLRCGASFPLPRIKGKQRENGHIKDMYCPKCGCITKFKEVKYNQFYKNMSGDKLL